MASYKMLVTLFRSFIISAPLLFCIYKMYKHSVVATIKHACLVTAVINGTFILCDIFYRLSYLVTNAMTSRSNRMENIKATARAAFTFNVRSILVITLDTFMFLILINTVSTSPFEYIWEFGPSVCVSSVIFTLFLLRAMNFYQWNTDESVGNSMKGLDYGTGMAYSYYYGYLRIVLPSTGTASKGLLEKIENFEDAHGVMISVKKLFILIPSSAYIYPNLKDMSNGWMQSVSPLEDEVRDRSGVQRRSYHNNIYKINPDGRKNNAQPVYVVAEGATPILTFLEVQRHSHPESIVYSQYSKDIINAFSTKLQELLRADLDCRDICEVVYYDDCDTAGNKINVAKILLNKISNYKNVEALTDREDHNF